MKNTNSNIKSLNSYQIISCGCIIRVCLIGKHPREHMVYELKTYRSNNCEFWNQDYHFTHRGYYRHDLLRDKSIIRRCFYL